MPKTLFVAFYAVNNLETDAHRPSVCRLTHFFGVCAKMPCPQGQTSNWLKVKQLLGSCRRRLLRKRPFSQTKAKKKWQGLNPHKPRRPAASLLFTIADEANVISCGDCCYPNVRREALVYGFLPLKNCHPMSPENCHPQF